MDAPSNPVAVSGLEVRTAGADVIVHDPEHEQVHVLNRIAGEVLAMCDGSHSIERIAAQLSARTGAPIERVQADVEAAIASFRTLRFVK